MEYSPGRRDSTTLSLEPSWLPSILFMLKFQNRFIKYFFVIFIIIIVYSLLSPLYPIDLYFAKCSIIAATPLLGLNTTRSIYYLDCLLRYLTFSLVLSILGSPPLLSLFLLRRPTPIRIYIHAGGIIYTHIILPAILHFYSSLFLIISGLALIAGAPQVQAVSSNAKYVYYAVIIIWLIFTSLCAITVATSVACSAST